MSTLFEPIVTADLVWQDDQPYPSVFNDDYFFKESAVCEAQHIFIDGNNLINRWQALPSENVSQFVIAETGFGSGLNFLLAWSLWRKHAPSSARLHYISCEKHPLTCEDLSRCLALWPQFHGLASTLLANYPILTPGFHLLQFDDGRVNLTLMLSDALSAFQELLTCGDASMEKQLRDYHVDAWFLDGFSSVKKPLMWSQTLFATIGVLSKKETTLTVFSTSSVIKQDLRMVGFNVSQKPGYACKKDMIVAEFDCAQSGHTSRYTPWHVAVPKPLKKKRALVLGAGLAGCSIAEALARRGWQVTLIDAETTLAGGASGIRQAILYPKLSAFSSPLNNFMLDAYIFAVRTYQNLLRKGLVGELSGILQLAYDDKERANQAKLQSWLARYPELGMLVGAEQASTLAGIELHSGGLFIPYSGWMDSSVLCRYLVQKPGINWVANTNIASLSYDGVEWHANEHHAEVLVVANAYRAAMFSQTAHLPLKAVRGQMTAMLCTEESAQIKRPLCAMGHILPARDGSHGLGATYHPGLDDDSCYVADDVLNMTRLDALSTEFVWSGVVASHWAGVRAVTPDYLPLVGPVANAKLFQLQFASLANDAKRWVPSGNVFYEGLYVCAGFGSRGLTSIPLSTEWLAATINKEPGSMPRTMIQSLSPSRFLRREIIRTNK